MENQQLIIIVVVIVVVFFLMRKNEKFTRAKRIRYTRPRRFTRERFQEDGAQANPVNGQNLGTSTQGGQTQQQQQQQNTNTNTMAKGTGTAAQHTATHKNLCEDQDDQECGHYSNVEIGKWHWPTDHKKYGKLNKCYCDRTCTDYNDCCPGYSPENDRSCYQN